MLLIIKIIWTKNYDKKYRLKLIKPHNYFGVMFKLKRWFEYHKIFIMLIYVIDFIIK